MASSNVDAKSVVEDITTKLLDTKQSSNTPSTTASSSTKSENYFTANEQQHQDDDSESEEEQQSQSDNESMNENDDNSDAMSEYSYCVSDDDEEQEVYDPTKNKSANKIQHQPVSVTHAGAKRKGKCFVGFVIYCYVIRIVYC